MRMETFCNIMCVVCDIPTRMCVCVCVFVLHAVDAW